MEMHVWVGAERMRWKITVMCSPQPATAGPMGPIELFPGGVMGLYVNVRDEFA